MTVIYRYVPADLDNMKFNKWAWQLKSRKEIRKFKKYLELAQAFTLYDEAKDKPVAVLAFHEYGEGMYYACIIASEDFGKNPKYAAKNEISEPVSDTRLPYGICADQKRRCARTQSLARVSGVQTREKTAEPSAGKDIYHLEHVKMGIETAVIAGLGLASAIGQYNQSKSEMKQNTKAGEIAAWRRADEIKRLASKQRVSYLSAGLELEGTPQAVVNDTYNTGIADVLAIRSAYNQKSKNILKSAQAQLLGNLAMTGVTAGFSAGGGGLFGNGVTEAGGGISTGSINGVYQGANVW